MCSVAVSLPLIVIAAPIFDAIQRITGHPEPYTDRLGKEDLNNKDMAYRVVADHIRTLCFAITDGSRPGNDGREYVLRRVLRRGVRYGREVLGGKEGFFSALVDVVVETMGPFYPELIKHKTTIRSVISEEEISFSRTLLKGIERFKKYAGEAKEAGQTIISGPQAFLLWDTYGFPIDLTELMAQEAGLEVDKEGFSQAMENAKELSRQGAKRNAGKGLKFEAEATSWLSTSGIAYTDDSPKYENSVELDTRVVAILGQNGFIDSTDDAPAEGALGLVLSATSFYAEAGGQVADTGRIITLGPTLSTYEVVDVRSAAGYVLHVSNGAPQGSAIKVGDTVTTKVDYARRSCIKPNHTFTHILNFALKDVLGDHVDQKGSIVLPDRLRFDFSNPGPVTPSQLEEIENICKQFLETPQEVSALEVPLAVARSIRGLRAVFGEVYPDPVRVVSVGKDVSQLIAEPDAEDNLKYSIEFCGGTHLSNTKEAQAFALLTEEGIAKGIRRIVCVTGKEAHCAISLAEELEADLANLEKISLGDSELGSTLNSFKVRVDEAVIPYTRKNKIREQMQGLNRALADELKKIAAEKKKRVTSELLEKAEEAIAAGATYLITRVDVGLDAKALQEAHFAIQKKYTLPLLIFSGGEEDGKVLAFAGVPDALKEKLPAHEWVAHTLKPLEGKGGGRAVTAQGMGPKVEAIGEAEAAADAFAQLKLQTSTTGTSE